MRKLRPVVVVLALLICSLSGSGLASATEQVGPKQFELPRVKNQVSQPIYWAWINWKSGMCLSISGGNMTNGTKAIQWPCSSTDLSLDQQWEAVVIDDGQYHLFRSRANANKCLAVPGSSIVRGTQLIIWDCDVLQADQYWKVDSLGVYPPTNEPFRITNLRSGLVMAVTGGLVTRGAAVIQWTYSGDPSQKWR
jgi:hypothetical protein